MADFKIRAAHIDDLHTIYVMVRTLLNESPQYKGRTPVPVKIVANLELYITEKNRCAFLAISGETIIGVMLGYTYTPEMFNCLSAADTMLYVEKPWRADGVGQELLETYAAWAATKGAGGNIYFGTTTQLTPEATQTMIKETGFKVIGQVARKQ